MGKSGKLASAEPSALHVQQQQQQQQQQQKGMLQQKSYAAFIFQSFPKKRHVLISRIASVASLLPGPRSFSKGGTRSKQEQRRGYKLWATRSCTSGNE